MPTTTQPCVKELYAFTSLSELQQQVDNIPRTSLLNFRKLIESADKLYERARLSYKEGDEETAYVYYMRAISLYQKARNARDFNHKLDIKYWTNMCGPKVKTAMSNSEALLNSLTRRYSLLEDVKNAKEKEIAEFELLQNEQMEFGRDRNVKKDCDTSFQTSSGCNSESFEKAKRSISCEFLYKLLQKNEVLILDTRPENEFEECHIKSSQCLNISPRILEVEKTGYKIENSLNVGVRLTFRKRQTINNIVLLDWDCQLSDIERKGTKLRILYDALNEFDHKVPINPTYVLDGGLKAFMFLYPTLATNSSYKFQPENGDSGTKSNERSIDSLLYPDLPGFRRENIVQDQKSIVTPSVPDRRSKPKIDTPAILASFAPNDENSPPTDSVTNSASLDDEICTKHGEMVSLLDSMSQKFDRLTRMFGKENPADKNGSEMTVDESPEDIRRKYEKLKAEVDLKARQCDRLERELDVQKLRRKKPDLKTKGALDTDENVKFELEMLKNEKDACLQEMQRMIIKPEPSKSYEVDDKALKQPIDDVHESTLEDLSRRSSLKRARSSPNVAKLTEDGVEENVSHRPQIPDRSTKPHGAVNSQEVLVQESDFFYKALRAMAGPTAAVNPGTTGLRNLGNTCYMNSVIQCLSNTDCLRKYFVLDGAYRNDINYSNTLGSRGTVARNFAVLLSSLWNGKFKYVLPTDFKYVVGSLAPAFANYEQQDAQEFLVFLLCALHQDLNKVYHKVAISEQVENDLNFEVAAQIVWQNFLTNDQSIIIDNFYGQFASVMKCAYCGNISRNFEAFMSLSVPIIENTKRCSLQDCLQKFLSFERLSSDCSVYCSRCQTKRETFKRMMLWRLPNVLIIHFNRFKTVGRLGEKMKTFVNFPVTELNFGNMPGAEIPSAPYKIFGIINHYGSMESGHYTAVCKQRDNWYKFDDQEVTVVSQGSIKVLLENLSCFH